MFQPVLGIWHEAGGCIHAACCERNRFVICNKGEWGKNVEFYKNNFKKLRSFLNH